MMNNPKVVCEMARAILSPIQERSLYRLHLWGGMKHATGGGAAMDEYIGRAAHVSYCRLASYSNAV